MIHSSKSHSTGALDAGLCMYVMLAETSQAMEFIKES